MTPQRVLSIATKIFAGSFVLGIIGFIILAAKKKNVLFKSDYVFK